MLPHDLWRVADARTRAADRRAEVTELETAIDRFRDDRQVPAEYVDVVWLRIADAVTMAAYDYLEERGDATAVEQAKTVRGVVQGWLQDQGHHIDTSRDFMADLPH